METMTGVRIDCIKPVEFMRALESVAFAADRETGSRWALSAVHLVLSDGRLL